MRSRDAGIDVMGDGALVPFRGGVVRQASSIRGDSATAFEVVERAMREEAR